MFEPTAEIIADSLNMHTGDRLTTFVLTYHRFIHSEFMTHRAFSRNASSSRAIPVQKNIEYVENLELYPLHWGKNQKGMQAYIELDEYQLDMAKRQWNFAKQDAIYAAKEMLKIGVHKQIVNRLLEPFNTITVICTATEYKNFFNQRCHQDAQPEIRVLAEKMKTAYETNKPIEVNPGYWHLPFINNDLLENSSIKKQLVQISTGRCARVSYLNHDGQIDVKADLELHDKLLSVKPAHLSPFEHPAIATNTPAKYANFSGFKSYRWLSENNNLV